MFRVMRGCMVLVVIFIALTAQAQDFKGVKRAAERGDAKAQYEFGLMYSKGLGVAQNDTEAVKWYRKAAEQGNAAAQHNLGVMYSAGQGTDQDYAEALKWYRMAAEQGHTDAQHNLGLMYATGQGVARDHAEAMKWYSKAAEQGDVNAQYRLGVSYDFGWGVAKNPKEAMKWYRMAADQGVAAAQYYLGVSYATGQGVAQNTGEAVKWYARAAGQGHEGAERALEAMKNRPPPPPTTAKQNVDPVELFGVKLKNATRAQLRAAFKMSSLQVEREENNYWVDLYYSDRALEGSSQLAVGCTDKGRFAYAEYTFPSHQDTEQVQRIADMVAAKYGKPEQFSGNIGSGEVEAVWQREQDMSIKVYRSWPDTTTYLRFTDSVAERQMLAEIEAAKATQTGRKTPSQSQAY